MSNKLLNLIGCASGLGGADMHSGDGPVALQESELLNVLIEGGVPLKWQEMFRLAGRDDARLDVAIAKISTQLANAVSSHLQKNEKVCVIGGDHSCAVGTWSGVYDAVHQKGDLGLIWIDAHMDSHTPETSDSGHIHGMPLAALLGFGYPSLTGILYPQAKLKPENVCLIGVRSFERGEAALLERLNVRVYFMNEVRQRGFQAVLDEAVKKVSEKTTAFGVSLDMDAIDPSEAPGVDVPEANGIHAKDLSIGLKQLVKNPKLIMTEIVEFDPIRDQNKITEKLMVSLLEILAQ